MVRSGVRSWVSGLIAVVLAWTVGAAPAVADVDEGALGGDRSWAVSLMSSGTPSVRRAAEAALLGSDSDLEAFVASGYEAALSADYRASAQMLGTTDGPGLTAASQAALAGSDEALRQFVEGGFKEAWAADERLRVMRALESGGPSVRSGAQTALAGGPKAWSEFLSTRLPELRFADERLMAATMLSGGVNSSGELLDAAADLAIAGSPDEVHEFLVHGQFVARARDQEIASVRGLTEQARQAGQVTANEAAAASEASVRAVGAAEQAKAAAQTALAEAAAAGGAASGASAAAGRAADAAAAAQGAASQASSASASALRAAQTAADGARQATAAASLTARAASAAQSAAAAARTDADKAQAARDAAQKARDAAAQLLVLEAIKAQRDAALAQAREAASAAAGASRNADAAASAADSASRQSGVSAAQAERTRAAAAAAKAQAAVAARAAQRALDFAEAAAAACDEAFGFAKRAGEHAGAAAVAADEAAAHAGVASAAADESTKHALAATAASVLADEAAAGADRVQQLARTADEARLDEATDQGIVDAQEVAAAEQAAAADGGEAAGWDRSVRWDTEEDARVPAAARALLDAATAEGASTQVVLDKGRRAAVALLGTGGEWTKAAAAEALAGDEVTLRLWLTQGRALAVGQDNRARVWHLVDSLPDGKEKTAARASLNGDDVAVAAFLRTRYYPGKIFDDRRAMAKILTENPGPALSDATNDALNGTWQQAHEFLRTGQHTARAADQRLEIARVMDAGGPEVDAAAQVALAGPASYGSYFLTVGQYEAAQRDVEQTAHVQAVEGLVQQAQQYAQNAMADAAEARRVAAVAKGAAIDAANSANQAAEAAAQAAAYEAQALQSAAAAKTSADQAAASAQTAKNAAAKAQTSANKAASSAATAAAAARNARSDAGNAQLQKYAAQDAAAAAGLAALDAARAGVEASVTYMTRVAAQEIADRSTEAGTGPGGVGTANDEHRYRNCLVGLASRDAWPACKEATVEVTEVVLSGGDCAPYARDRQAVMCQALDYGTRSLIEIAETRPDLLLALALDVTQVMLGICGFVPGYGEACDGIDMTMSGIRGDWTGFWLSAGAAVPLGGWVPGAAKVGENVTSMIRSFDKIEGVLRTARESAQSAARACSFAASTLVLMADGTRKAIAEITIGDEVTASDPQTGEQRARKVSHVFVHEDTISDLALADGTVLGTTEDHPFWSVTDARFERADELEAAEQVLTADGRTLAVEGLRGATSRTAPAYNLEVEGIHTFHVGVNDVLVHNRCELDIDGIEHAQSRHTWGGAELDETAGVFDRGVDFDVLSQGYVGQIGRVGKYGNIEYVLEAPDIIGVTGRTSSNPAGFPTKVYTVIRNPYDGSLETMFPGVP